MLQVEGKTFHKFVEFKSYKTQTYKNYCSVENNGPYYSSNDTITNKTGRFHFDELYLSEDEFVNHFGNPFPQVDFVRRRIFIEEGEESISLKAQYYHKWRAVGKKFFVVRKHTNYLSFNFKTKSFYYGVFQGKNKKKIGNTMKVNPTFNVLLDLEYALKIDDNVRPDSYFYFFLEKIWDKLGLQNPQNFETNNFFTHYSLTKYLIQGVKIPNAWLKFTSTFVPIKEIRNSNMNFVDALMKRIKVKGSKIKKILNEFESVDFDRMVGLYYILGVDKFNQLPDKIFDEYFSNKQWGIVKETNQNGGRFWCSLTQDYKKEFMTNIPNLTPKEKDRILYLANVMDNSMFHTLLDHLSFKIKLKNLGEDVKIKFENISSFNAEHEEWSRLLDSYRKGEVERFYGEVDSLETPIIYEGETYYPVLLRKTIDYEKESQHQKNCVRTYSERPDCLIFSIRKSSVQGEERATVEYQYRKNEILNVQERARFNQLPNEAFSNVARIQLANINLMYKLGTLKLPKMVKKYRAGKVTEQVATFELDFNTGTRVIPMTPRWNYDTQQFSHWQNEILNQDYLHLEDNNFFEDLLP